MLPKPSKFHATFVWKTRLVSIGIDRDTDTVSAILFQYRYRYRRYFSTGVTQAVSAILLGPIFTDNRYRYFLSRSSGGSAANDDNFEKKCDELWLWGTRVYDTCKSRQQPVKADSRESARAVGAITTCCYTTNYRSLCYFLSLLCCLECGDQSWRFVCHTLWKASHVLRVE